MEQSARVRATTTDNSTLAAEPDPCARSEVMTVSCFTPLVRRRLYVV